MGYDLPLLSRAVGVRAESLFDDGLDLALERLVDEQLKLGAVRPDELPCQVAANRTTTTTIAVFGSLIVANQHHRAPRTRSR